MKRWISAPSALLRAWPGLALAPSAWAHSGHGASAPHWHAFDAGSLLLALALVAGLWFLGRRK